MKKPRPSEQASHRPSGFFLLRTPLRSIDELIALGEDLVSARASGEALAAAVERDVQLVRQRLRTFLARPMVRDALLVASPSLAATQPLWEQAPDSQRGRGFEPPAARYVARMSGRCTPFGLFAGCSVGHIEATTELRLEAAAGYRRFSRLDIDYLESVIAPLRGQMPDAARRLRVNSSLYTTTGEHRYVETHIRQGSRTHRLVRAERTEYLDAVLAGAREGATAAALAQALCAADSTLTIEEAHDFLLELESAQILCSDLELLVTGEDPARALLRSLQPLAAAEPLARALASVLADIDEIDRTPLGESDQAQKRLAGRLSEPPLDVATQSPLHVELHKPGEVRLSRQIVERIWADLRALSRLARPVPYRPLANFRQAFERRFEGRVVPLALALDEENGVGFGDADGGRAELAGEPLLAGLPFYSKASALEKVEFPYQVLLPKLLEVWRSGGMELTLDDRDLEALADKPLELPDAFSIAGTLLAESAEALDRGDFRFHLESFHSFSAGALLGRFSAGSEPLRDLLREHMQAEQALHPDRLLAEIVHQPDGRMGNITARPLLRSHEIPYLGRSGAPEDRQIPIDDLLVAVRGERIILWSKRLDCEVCPRLTSAHNTLMSSLGIYRFLAALPLQGATAIQWPWGELRTAPFLPRVVYRGTVLEWARWTVDRAELRRWQCPTLTETFAAVQSFRQRVGLPRWICITDGDHRLPIDLDNVLSVDSMVDLLKHTHLAILEEYGLMASAPCVRSPEGRFVHEVIIPFVRRAPPERQVPALGRELFGTGKRTFVPGSEWTYLKLYSGVHTLDGLVAGALRSFADRFNIVAEGAPWFFIRYADPLPHLRLRFRVEDPDLRRRLIDEALGTLVPHLGDYGVYTLQLDSYDREVERYGGPEGILLAERFFHLDSELVSRTISTLLGAGIGERWPYALWGMHRLLDAAGLDLVDRDRLLTQARDAVAERLQTAESAHRILGGRFRERRRRLEALLRGEGELLTAGEALAPAWEAHQRACTALFRQLWQREKEGVLSRPVLALLSSFLHMHANRMLRAAPNQYEVVLYDFLIRLYDSAAARARKNVRPALDGMAG